jgi:hypothetical protein
MQKVIKALLEAKFPTISADSLLEIIEATPRHDVAVEILCGLYEEPVPSQYSDMHEKHGKCTFIAYDKWQDRVHYSYMKKKVKSMYVHKDCDTSLITMDNYKDYSMEWSQGESKHYDLPTGEEAESKDWASLENWEARSLCLAL